jgi:hypothetical protein
MGLKKIKTGPMLRSDENGTHSIRLSHPMKLKYLKPMFASGRRVIKAALDEILLDALAAS